MLQAYFLLEICLTNIKYKCTILYNVSLTNLDQHCKTQSEFSDVLEITQMF